jgi:hypothetical protein
MIDTPTYHRPMCWTNLLPRSPGVYWLFERGDLAVCEIVIDEETGTALALLTGDDELYDATDLGTLWFGPIEAPEPPSE